MCLSPNHQVLQSPNTTNKAYKSAVRLEMKKRSLEVDAKSLASTLKTLLVCSSPPGSQQLIALEAIAQKLELAIQEVNQVAT